MIIVAGQPGHSALDAALDIFRMRQYFNVVVRAREHLARLRRQARTPLVEPVPY